MRPSFDAACGALAGLGCELREVALPLWDEGMIAARVLLCAEGFAYHRTNLAARWDDYTPGTRRWLLPGALLSAADTVQAQRVRRVVRDRVAGLFADVDLVLAPTSPTTAPRYDDFLSAPPDARSALTMVFTPYWNLTGNPVLAIPIGFDDAGLPLSMQVVGRPFDERTVLRAGHAYQQVTSWHRRVPPILEGAR
jgi:aspartyl-tRNA(Asn)/glutamyl-tRNA(Gln) amidotransferase subunit A